MRDRPECVPAAQGGWRISADPRPLARKALHRCVSVTSIPCPAPTASCRERPLEPGLGDVRAIAAVAMAKVGQESDSTLEVVLSMRARGNSLRTDDLNLNGNLINGFIGTINISVRSFLIVDRGRTRHPHLALAGEKPIQFAARDLDGRLRRGEAMPSAPRSAIEAFRPRRSGRAHPHRKPPGRRLFFHREHLGPLCLAGPA